MNCKQGDVVLVLFPNSDLKTFKKRPALVVQSDNIQTNLDQKIIALITSNINRTGETRIFVKRDSEEGIQMGLATDSVIVIDNLVTVVEREIYKVIGKCIEWNNIAFALRKVFDL